MIKRVGHKSLWLAAGTSALALIPGAAFGQAAPLMLAGAAAESAAAADTAETAVDDDIIVTATKRNEPLQEAVLSATAIGIEALRQQNVTEVTGLNGLVPGLLVARSGGGERMITIRGVGSETPENANTQPGVSYHIDGVYIFNTIAANAAFIDVGQVEVLRGPQGTTFGQGSTGGTINIVSRQPTLDGFKGSVSAGVGNYDMKKGDASVNVPIGEHFAVRGAFQFQKHSGYAIATGVAGDPSYDLDDQDETGWKLAALWQPTDEFSILLSTIQFDSDTHGPAQKNILDPNPDPRELTQDYPGRSKVKTQLYYGVVKYENDAIVAKSLTSYQKLYSAQSWDGDALTPELFERNILGGYKPPLNGQPERLGSRYDHVALWRQRTESWTQEFNLSSNGEGPFSWILGAVYLHSKNPQYIVEYRARGNPLQPALPEATPFNDPLVSTVTFAELSQITREAYAGYAELSYEITPALTLTGGLRYNHDKYSGISDTNSGGAVLTSGAYLQPVPTVGLTTNKWTGKAAIDYKITPDNMVYFSFTRGFKPGGLNSSAANAAPQTLGFANGIRPTYKPETVDSFELGSKNKFGSGGKLNLSAFYYNYKNLQFLDEDAILFGEGTANAPKAEIYGLEAEYGWRFNEQWSLDGTASLTRGKFTADYLALDPAAAVLAQNAAGYYGTGEFFANFFAAATARDSARANINGNRVPKIPKFSGSATLTFSDQVGPGQLTAKATGIYRGSYQYRLFNNSAFDKTPDYAQVNLFLQYAPDDTNLAFALSVTNLFDKDGVNSRVSDPYGSAQTYETYIAPRQFLGTVTYNF